MKPILVIGATGNVGSELVRQLTAANVPVRAMSRNPNVASVPAGAESVPGDLTVPDSMERALDNVSTVFLVWVAPAAAAAAAIERIARRAQRIVFLSAPYQTPHPFFQQPNPMARMHAEVEGLIRASGVEWTFLRPGMFAINCVRWWASQIRAGDVVRWPYAQAPTAPIHEHDITAVAVRALVDDRHAGQDYVLTGPESLTQQEQVNSIGDSLGRSLRFHELAPDEARRELLAIIPSQPVIDMLLNAWAAALGQPAYVTNSVPEITGAAAKTFRQWAVDHAHDFSA